MSSIADLIFELEIRLELGLCLWGEETVLINQLKENGMPNPQTTIPIHKGVWGKPTILNNVETMQNIAQIIQHGADWFKSIGTESSPGTKSILH